MPRPNGDRFYDSQFTGDATRLSLTGSSQRVGALQPGMYIVTADVDCRIKQGDSAVTVSSTTGMPLWSKTFFGPIFVDATTNAYVAALAAGGSGTLELAPVS